MDGGGRERVDDAPKEPEGRTGGPQNRTAEPGKGRPVRKAATPFPSAHEDRLHTRLDPETPQTLSPAYRLSYEDPDFMMRDELRATRLQLEFLKPDLLMRDRGIAATIVVFGSARIPDPEDSAARLEAAERLAANSPDVPEAARQLQAVRNLVKKSRYYDEARRLTQMICTAGGKNSPDDACVLQHEAGSVVVVTGGGPGVMEAANRGAHDIGAENIGLNIVLPFEQAPNPYITPHLCFNFHYFAIRKMHFLLRAIALVVFPGGYGTLDELFEVLTLIQTHKIERIPVLLFSREYWERIIDFQAMVEEGVIAPADIEIFRYVETAEEAWHVLKPVIEAVAAAAG
jgi:uncharacterized protein (TIGR00730 family)